MTLATLHAALLMSCWNLETDINNLGNESSMQGSDIELLRLFKKIFLANTLQTNLSLFWLLKAF